MFDNHSQQPHLNTTTKNIKKRSIKKLTVSISSAFLFSIISLSAHAHGGNSHSKVETTKPNLDAILSAQSEETQQRYQYRHPKETLEFFKQCGHIFRL